MKENDMLEQMFSAVAQLLGQRENALLERIEALKKRVVELEEKLEEVSQAGAAGFVAGPVERADDFEEKGVEVTADDFEEMPEPEELEIVEPDGDKVYSVADSGDVGILDSADDEVADEPEMEIEVEFFEDEETVVEDADVLVIEDDGPAEDSVDGNEEEIKDEVGADDVNEDLLEAVKYSSNMADDGGDEADSTVLVVDKARPDWYDWEVDIPGSYIEEIWDGIGLNDRLLFLKELFSGDEIDFSETLDALNEMATLVEAVEYIRGRYSFWDEESDEVYRFYMTVRRRFNKQRQEI